MTGLPTITVQVADSVAGRLRDLPLMFPGLTGETQAKLLLSVAMIMGRLEILSLLILLMPSFYR